MWKECCKVRKEHCQENDRLFEHASCLSPFELLIIIYTKLFSILVKLCFKMSVLIKWWAIMLMFLSIVDENLLFQMDTFILFFFIFGPFLTFVTFISHIMREIRDYYKSRSTAILVFVLLAFSSVHVFFMGLFSNNLSIWEKCFI